jgi:hypothetical protein
LNKQELEEYQDLQIESSSNQKLEEYWDPQIESSKTSSILFNQNFETKTSNKRNHKQETSIKNLKKQKLSDEYDADLSRYSSNDTDYTKKLKQENKILGKKLVDNDEVELENDLEQIRIQQNYQEELNKQQVNETDNFEYTEEAVLDIGFEEPYEQFT